MTANVHHGFHYIRANEVRRASEECIANRSRFLGTKVSSYTRAAMIHSSALALVYATSFIALPYFTYMASIAAYSTTRYAADTKFGKGLTQCTEATVDKTVTTGSALFQTAATSWNSSESKYRPSTLNVMRLSLF